MTGRWRGHGLGVLGLLLLCGGCEKAEPERRGELMLSLATDLAPPKDFDRIEVEVLSFGNVQFKNEYTVGSGQLTFPATLGIAAGEGSHHPVTIRITARLGKRVRYLREVVTTVPEDRVALLSIRIEWLCLDQAKEDDEGLVSSTCGEGLTCILGECALSDVDSTTLPNYRAPEVFGGGDGTGNGQCFDTLDCFSKGVEVAVDPADCTVAATGNDQVSVALVREPGSEGICGPGACLIPLDSGVLGGSMAESRLALPPAVCSQLEAGKVTGVAVTSACEPKTSSLPTCGEWSSVVTQEVTTTATPPTPLPGGGTVGAGGTATGGNSPPVEGGSADSEPRAGSRGIAVSSSGCMPKPRRKG